MIQRFKLLFVLAVGLLFVVSTRAQTVAGSIVGTAVDQSGAVVPGAGIVLRSPATGITRTARSNASGVFRFPNLNPDTYNVTINATGFKQNTTTGIELGQGETRDLGKIALEVGAISQEVTVSAAVTPIQTSSSEKSTELTGSELNALPLRGRDLFSAVRLVPGVVDTNEGISTNGRDVTSPNAISGITINGNTSAKNFTVDGITDMDTGSNGTLHFEPNMDSIQEVKVLSSNYQAEYGRNSGGTITVVTKSGTQQFHGSGWWNYRNNWMNANDWFNKQDKDCSLPACNIKPRAKYRYDVRGYSIGGPVYIPGHFNTEKKRLFFFFSQEYTGQFVPGTTEEKTTPTEAEVGLGPATANCPAGSANFYGIKNSSGSVIAIQDPLNNYQVFGGYDANGYPVNCIPASRIDPQGQQMLQFFPKPNSTPTGVDANQYNFFSQVSGNHIRRNDTLRIDVNPTSKLTAYFRYINDHDDAQSLYNGIQFVGDEPLLNGSSGNPANSIDHPNPGHGYAGSAIWTISPTLVNEATVAEDWNTWSWYMSPEVLAERSRNSKYNKNLNPPVLFPLPPASNISNANGYFNLLPGLTFGGGQNSEMSYANGTPPYFNENPIWTFEDNLTKIVGQHQFKMGVYWEHNEKIQPAGNGYAGAFNFGTSSTNPLSTSFGACNKTTPAGIAEVCGDGYADAILGYYNTYTQQTARTVFDVNYQNLEFYVQDNWRVTRRLTLDLGIRFYHQTPQLDANNTFSEFTPSLYSVANAPRVFVPACAVALNPAKNPPCPANQQKAVDPQNPGTLLPGSDIGAFVPGTGNPANGMHVLGKAGAPAEPYTTGWLAPGPRIGFAYDVFGNSKTALRGGFGVFFNRLDGNQVYNMSGLPPLSYTQADNQDCLGLNSNSCLNGGLASIQAQGSGGVIAPVTVNFFGGKVPWLVVRNASLGLQQDIGFKTVLDVAWTGNFTRHANLRTNLNPIPLGADWTNVSPVTGQPLTQNGSVLERTGYKGWQDIDQETFNGYTNYNALTASVQRRLSNGLLLGVAYTFSKTLGVTSFDPLVPNNDARNYGPESTDRRHNLLINYSYDLPDPGKKLNNKFLGFALDNWVFSGLTTFQSGAPINPSFSGGNTDGSGTESARANYSGAAKNLSAINSGSCKDWGSPAANVRYIFNPCAFTPATQDAAWDPTANGGQGGVVATACTATCLGTQGVGQFYGNGLNNFDLTLEKKFPLGADGRRAFRIQFQAYNAFNHPQFITVNSSATFTPTMCNASGTTCGNSSPLLIASEKTNSPKFGQATGDTGYRILSLNVRFEF